MSSLPPKRLLVDQLVAQLQHEAGTLEAAARAAHEAATHEESRAEDHHDTRGLEASYLAGAQAQRAAELAALISVYRQMPLKDFGPSDPIAPGALVTVEMAAEGGRPARKSHYLVVPRGGGVTLKQGALSVLVIAPQSPFGEALVGRKQGEGFEVETREGSREYEVAEVR
jgi:transcription elongation GreA/GreB family factor